MKAQAVLFLYLLSLILTFVSFALSLAMLERRPRMRLFAEELLRYSKAGVRTERNKRKKRKSRREKKRKENESCVKMRNRKERRKKRYNEETYENLQKKLFLLSFVLLFFVVISESPPFIRHSEFIRPHQRHSADGPRTHA